MKRGASAFSLACIALGLAFLYVPIALLVVYSFNASRSVGVWAGFSTRWYGELMRDQQLLDSLGVTLRVGAVSATAATALGLLAAIALTRGGRFPARRLFEAATYAPLVMPEVILGLALLLLFVGLGVPRGFWTVTAAHVTLSLGYATVVIQARLAGVDRSIEEAAQDLGCPPWKAFALAALPAAAPGLAAAWMLAFTLSLDDLVVASFTAGPGSTTLPMRIYSAVRLGVSPKINAASSLLVAAVAVGVIVVWALQQREARREARA